MAVNLQAIHRALAEQIYQNTGADKTVYAFPIDDPHFPCITVYPGDGTYLNYAMSFDGEADLMLRLKLDVSGDAESMAIQICTYLSTGTGNGSSIVDAVNQDRKLGGVVENCQILTSEWDAAEPGVAWLPVAIYLNRE